MNDQGANTTNSDATTVSGFGEEWSRFSYSTENPSSLDEAFDAYFSIFPWDELPPGAVGFDAGCGSGRWAERVAKKVGHLHCIDASAEALDVAREKLANLNCSFHCCELNKTPLPNASMDFGFSLGVLHHIPDTALALEACVRLLKPGAPFLVYLYYSLDNRGPATKLLWRTSDLLRRAICRLPRGVKFTVCDALALSIYWPLARSARLGETLGANVEAWPLSSYRNSSFYIMRNDSLDRFGTVLEQRFSRKEIASMMHAAGLEQVQFREGPPYWVALGFKPHQKSDSQVTSHSLEAQ